jgi:hypothetical protein
MNSVESYLRGKVLGTAEAFTRPITLPGKQVQIINSPGSKVATGVLVTL